MAAHVELGDSILISRRSSLCILVFFVERLGHDCCIAFEGHGSLLLASGEVVHGVASMNLLLLHATPFSHLSRTLANHKVMLIIRAPTGSFCMIRILRILVALLGFWRGCALRVRRMLACVD